MTSDPGNHKTEKELEKDLEEIRSVLADQDTAEPPELVDRAIMNAARRELAGTGMKWLPRVSLRSMGAFATASVVLLALGIIVQQEQELPTGMNEEADRTRQRTVAPAMESKNENGVQMQKMDRDDTAQKRSIPLAAAPARTSKLVSKESADAPAQLAEEAPAATPPEEWIKIMLELKSSNLQEQLARELEAFREAYPEYKLPPELDDR